MIQIYVMCTEWWPTVGAIREPQSSGDRGAEEYCMHSYSLHNMATISTKGR